MKPQQSKIKRNTSGLVFVGGEGTRQQSRGWNGIEARQGEALLSQARQWSVVGPTLNYLEYSVWITFWLAQSGSGFSLASIQA